MFFGGFQPGFCSPLSPRASDKAVRAGGASLLVPRRHPRTEKLTAPIIRQDGEGSLREMKAQSFAGCDMLVDDPRKETALASAKAREFSNAPGCFAPPDTSLRLDPHCQRELRRLLDPASMLFRDDKGCRRSGLTEPREQAAVRPAEFELQGRAAL